MLRYRPYYWRHLPHCQPPGATLFIAFRLAGSLPRTVIEELLAQQHQAARALEQIPDADERMRQTYLESRRAFARWDEELTADQGPRWLAIPNVANLVAHSLHYRDDQVYRLDAFCIMPNRIHLVCAPLQMANGEYHALSSILHSLKRYTAREANKLLKRRGAFWQQESYDHVVRDESEFRRIVRYVMYNPVKAGLAAAWEEWPQTYVAAMGGGWAAASRSSTWA